MLISIAAERNAIADQIKANGGIYEGDLTKSITHLISFRTEGAKYRAARSWGLKVVSIEWLQDTLERGMILNEETYDPLLPPAERGVGAWDRTKPRNISLGKRQREDAMVAEGGKRKLRRSASSKFTTQSSQIWGDIVSRGSMAQVAGSGKWESAEHDVDQSKPTAKTDSRLDTSAAKSRSIGMFSGHHFHYYGFPARQAHILQNLLLSHGAEIHDTLEDLGSVEHRSLDGKVLIMVPHDFPQSKLKPIPQSNTLIKYVTEWWLEQCLHSKKFMNPQGNVIGRPFKCFPIPGFEDLSIATSAFSGIDLLHVTKAIKLLGAKYHEEMTVSSNIVLTKTFGQIRQDKYDFAKAWKIPIVSADWLWQCIEAGQKLPLREYRARAKEFVTKKPINEATAGGLSSTDISDLEQDQCRPVSRMSKVPLKEAPAAGHPKIPKVIKVEEESNEDQILQLSEGTNTTTQENPRRSEPLAEIDNNAATNVPSPPGLPQLNAEQEQEEEGEEEKEALEPEPQLSKEQYDTTAISNLLSRTKSAALPKDQRKKRILGRAASNMSNGSSHSRSTSVDPTGSNTLYPSHHAHLPREASVQPHQVDLAPPKPDERMEMLLSGGGPQHEETQQPLTQLTYEDPASKEHEEMLRAKMSGRKISPRKGAGRSKTMTLGDADKMSGAGVVTGDGEILGRTRRSKR